MLRISNRSCRIGTSINTRTEMHGDDSVTAIDIPLGEIMLDAAELNMVLCEPHAHQVLFATRDGGKFIEPVFRVLKALRLAGKIEGAHVTLELGGKNTLKLSECKIARIELAPQAGGLTAMSLQVQCVPKLDSLVARLLEKLNCEIEVEVTAQGYGDQKPLPFGATSNGKNGDEDDDDDEEGTSRTGSKPRGRRSGGPWPTNAR